MASSSIVIKVKFGETLRRLNASIKDKKLALDMDLLEDKIRSLFNLGSDVEFTMTYVDEDGDDVTLADDSDLHDVVQQSLNPLRITVNLKGSNFNGSNGISTHSFTTKPSLRILSLGTPGSNPSLPKLNSAFVLDVNVLDGTVMAPHTAFTKIWRMRNNGSIAWPYGSQFQWIGGNHLSILRSVNVEIPVHGLPVDKEGDVAVDFTAPKIPGRYFSYWRMSSPSGEKFGLLFWVDIQVDASMKNSVLEFTRFVEPLMDEN